MEGRALSAFGPVPGEEAVAARRVAFLPLPFAKSTHGAAGGEATGEGLIDQPGR